MNSNIFKNILNFSVDSSLDTQKTTLFLSTLLASVQIDKLLILELIERKVYVLNFCVIKHV